MQVKFYKTASETNRIGKTLTGEIVINGTFKKEVDIINPVIAVTTDVTGYNYCYIPDLARYYFIEKVEITRTNLYTLQLHVDVLESYKDAIKGLTVIVGQSQSNPYYDGYINGVDVRTNDTIKEFENNFNEDGEIVLIAVYGQERV